MSAVPPVVADLAFLDKRAVADLMRCSTKHVDRMAKDGRMPPPVKLGRLCRWPRAVIVGWLADGCPALPTSASAATN